MGLIVQVIDPATEKRHTCAACGMEFVGGSPGMQFYLDGEKLDEADVCSAGCALDHARALRREATSE